MKSINRIEYFLLLIPAIAIIFLMPVMTNAEQRVVVKEYTYKASDIDSKISSRAIALEQVKRSILEEVGTFVHVKTEVINYQLESDQIKSLTAGIVGIKILDETWDGESYYIRAEATVDNDNIANDINALLQNQNQVAEIESINKKVGELLDEIEKLKADIQNMPDQSSQKQEYIARYDDSINQLRSMELVQDSYVDINSGNYETAMSSLSSAYVLSPIVVGPTVYIARSIVYARQNQYQQAFSNLDRSLRLNPNIAHRVALNRAFVYERSGNKEKALIEINKAILANPRFVPAYHQRSSAYKQQGYLEKSRENTMLAAKIQKQQRQQIANIEMKRQEIIKETKERGERIRQQQDVQREQERQQKARTQEKRQEKIMQREAKQQSEKSQQQQVRQKQLQRKQESRQQQTKQQQAIQHESRQNQKATQQVKQHRQQRTQESKQPQNKQETRQQHQGQGYRR
ncbi:MAG TPA: hypothetical protein DCG53_00805 [Syntrophus sp. (in: bacteria)]|jgi:tetratricopeptide (TPR) repeat protein|nr:hypothetical protein [Syntrophus sp. (in: bacteria)]